MYVLPILTSKTRNVTVFQANKEIKTVILLSHAARRCLCVCSPVFLDHLIHLSLMMCRMHTRNMFYQRWANPKDLFHCP